MTRRQQTVSVPLDRPVQIFDLGQVVVVKPDQAEITAGIRTQRISLAGPDSQILLQKEHTPLYASSKDGDFGVYPASALPYLRCQLEQQGLDYEYHPLAGPRLLTPAAGAGQDRLTDFLNHNKRGTVLVREASLVSTVIARTAQAFPDSRIMVVGYNTNLQRVRQGLPNTVKTAWITQSSQKLERTQVIFASFTGAGHNEARLHDCDFVFLPDALHIQHLQARPLLHSVDQQFRLFGFLDENRRLSDREYIEQLLYYGPARLHMLRKHRYARGIEICWQQTDRANIPRQNGLKEPLEIKQWGIWHNKQRNELVARRVLQFAGRDWATLQLQQSALPERYRDRVPVVAVLVENRQHAEELQQRLPEFRLVDDAGTLAAGPAGMILTHDTLDSDVMQLVDVLVRADGGNGVSPRLQDAVTHNKNRPLTIVDFKDRHHSKLKTWTECRLSGYRRLGWRELDRGSPMP